MEILLICLDEWCKRSPGKRENVFCLLSSRVMFQYGDRRQNFLLVCNMACLGTGRLCAKVEKLYSFGKNGPARQKTVNFVTNASSCNQQRGKTLHTFQNQSSQKRINTIRNNRSLSSTTQSATSAIVAPSPVPISVSLQTTIPVYYNINDFSAFKLSVQSENIRRYSTLRTQHPGSLPDTSVDPYRLLEDDLKDIYDDIRSQLRKNTNQEELQTIATYYFDGQGKALRPMVAILMARAINHHMYGDDRGLRSSQRDVAMISEMIHSASLIHDDVIDQSDFRRGKPSVNVLWNHKKVTMAGDYILAVASMMIARLRNDEVTLTLSQVVTDLVQGEFMQLGSKETENERFAHYLTKTYRKTASLIANSLKSVAMLAGADEALSEVAFQYGRNIGLAFQLVDDMLDFVSSSAAMGKPTAADLKLGLATAPVLFACEKFPELNPMIMRRFQEPGDVEKAFELVHKSQGLEQTRFLARKHCSEAVRLANTIVESPYQKGLIVVSDFVINRMK